MMKNNKKAFCCSKSSTLLKYIQTWLNAANKINYMGKNSSIFLFSDYVHMYVYILQFSSLILISYITTLPHSAIFSFIRKSECKKMEWKSSYVIPLGCSFC